jgi:hypothetical protein
VLFAVKLWLGATAAFFAARVVAQGGPLDGLELSQSFAAVGDDGTGTPPDPQGAAGPDFLLAMTNTRFSAQRKDGTPAASWTPTQFWAPVAQGDSLFDPRVMYDALSGRWIAVMATEGVTAAPALLLAVSAGPDPTQPWRFHRLDADPARRSYAEFPLLGASSRWICVSADLLLRDGGGLVGGAVWAIEKAPLLANDTLLFSRLTTPPSGLPLTPVVTFDADEADEFLVGEFAGDDNGQGKLELARVTDVGGQVEFVEAGLVAAPTTWEEHPIPFDSSPQSGTSVKITSPQADVASACLRHGMIWAVHAVTVPAGAVPLHTAVQWWRLTTAGGRAGFGRIEDAAGATWLGYPSVAVNARDQVLIGYSMFSAGSFGSAGYSLRVSADCDAQLSEIHPLRNGDAPYVRRDVGGLNRWGDLTETVVDPSDDTGIWTVQEYAAPPVDGQGRWGTWWGGFTPAAMGRALACVTPTTEISPVPVQQRGLPPPP